MNGVGKFFMATLGIVFVYTIVTHGAEVNNLLKTSFAGTNDFYGTLMGNGENAKG